MQLLAAPKTNKTFWLYHIMGWSFISILNFVNRQSFNVEPLSHGVVSLALMIIINGTICLLFREMLYRFKIIYLRLGIQWIFLVFGAAFWGFVSSFLMLYALGAYYWLMGYSSSIVFFMNQVFANWLVIGIMTFLWAIIYTLANHFYQLQKVKEEHDALNLKLKEAELSTLLGQLNPHFLFNALNNIRSLMLIDKHKAREMLTALSELLRYSLRSNKQPFRTLDEEVIIVRHYIELARIQYEERLNYQEDIDSALGDVAIPSMIVQLLVENAVRHGIDKHLGAGSLSLEIKQKNANLVVKVLNPGELDSSREDKDSHGIGLQNIRRRLELSYGQQASLSVRECFNANEVKQVEAIMTLPLNDTRDLEKDESTDR
ncbi:sensor histidine kinase [Pleionea sediminis]|uniref:sensor histidine kinase n=1 Tax=Pleionea sediminis TaxID=2569479 RepID=UPI001184AD3C|nr:histidine kinase [Pleionea sediminis]